MNLERFVARAAHVVDKSLRKAFPDDYNIRCLFASSGMNFLAQRAGFSSRVIAGGFFGITATPDLQDVRMLGYDAPPGEFAHYWCEISGHLVDLGLMYLSMKTALERAPAPVCMWPLHLPLPPWLVYTRGASFGDENRLYMAPTLAREVEDFLRLVEGVERCVPRQSRVRSWLLTGRPSLIAKSRAGDLWALGAIDAERTIAARKLSAEWLSSPKLQDATQSVCLADAAVGMMAVGPITDLLQPAQGELLLQDGVQGAPAALIVPPELVVPADAVNDPVGLIDPDLEPVTSPDTIAVVAPAAVARRVFNWGNLRPGMEGKCVG